MNCGKSELQKALHARNERFVSSLGSSDSFTSPMVHAHSLGFMRWCQR